MTETALVKSLADIESDREVKTLAQQATDLKARADSLAIHDEPSLKAASDLRLEANRILKDLETRRKFFVDPHNQFVKTINAWFKNPGDLLSGAVSLLGSRMVKYDDEQTAKAKAAADKILADKRTTPETKSVKIAQIDTPPPVVRSEQGSTSFRIDKKLKIVDAAQLPREYLVPDERFILAALKAGKVVPGAILEEVKVPVGRSSF